MIEQAKKPLISICCPVLNEEENIEIFYSEMLRVIEPMSPSFDFEFIFTDNHSTDKTFEIISELSAKDSRIRAARFSRNFGYQRSIHTGFMMARGDAAISYDCDLQDPPELLSAFIEKWRTGYRVVYGIRRTRDESMVLRSLRRAFYRFLAVISEEQVPIDAGDFRLIDRRIIEELRGIEDEKLYLRGLIAAMGFSQIGIPYDRRDRNRGHSKFPFIKLLSLALDGVLSQSVLPLRMATFVGFAVFAVTLFLTAFYAISAVVLGSEWPRGFATTTILMLFSIGLNSLFLGIIGEYVGRLYSQARRRPKVIIEAKIDR